MLDHATPPQTFLLPDGMLRIVEWAHGMGISDHGNGLLIVDKGDRPTPMAGSPATGQALVTNGTLGVDLIHLNAGEGFSPHTHPGDHLLIVVFGYGTITYNGMVYPTQAGQVYMVEGAIPHAVGAITEHAILAVGSPHKAVDDVTRMTPVAYQSVTADLGSLHCLICNTIATVPDRLHNKGCVHCPCGECP